MWLASFHRWVSKDIEFKKNARFIHCSCSRLLDVCDKLALVGALEQKHPGRRHIFEFRLHNVFVLSRDSQSAILNTLLEQLDGLGPLISEVHNNEAFQFDAHADNLEPILETGDGIPRAVVVRDGATSSNTAVLRHAGKHQVQNLAADVVEVDVGEIRRGLLQVCRKRGGLVVQALVCAETLHPRTLFVAARDADHTLAADELLGDLDGHATGSTGGAGDDNDVFGRRTRNLGQTAPSGQAGKSKSTKVVSRIKATGELRSGLDLVGGQHDLLCPTGGGDDDVALLELGGSRLDDFGETASAHDLALLDGGHVEAGGVLHLAQPATLGRVIGEVEGLDEDVVVLDGAGLSILEGESGVGSVNHGAAVWSIGKNPLACLNHGCGVVLIRLVYVYRR
jgi:hypothetical protein